MKKKKESPVLGYKYCEHCGKLLPYSCFFKNGKTDDGLRRVCMECEELLRLEKKGKSERMKICSHCKSILPISSFRKNSSRPDGFHSECKECDKESHKRYCKSKKRNIGDIYEDKSGRFLVYNGGKSRIYWTPNMIKELYKYTVGVKIKDIAASLGLSPDFVSLKIKELGITKPYRFVSDDFIKQQVRLYYPTTANKELAERLGCSVKSIIYIAQREGLHKDKEYQRQVWFNNAKHACECNRKKLITTESMTKKNNPAMPESPSLGGVGEAITHTQAHARYCATCNELLQLFCAKHDYQFEPDCWVGGDVGGIAAIGDYFVDMQTIVVDLREDAPEEEFIRWYDYCLDANELHLTSPNYRSWLHGCPRIPEERLQRLRDLRAQLAEETERIKREF